MLSSLSILFCMTQRYYNSYLISNRVVLLVKIRDFTYVNILDFHNLSCIFTIMRTLYEEPFIWKPVPWGSSSTPVIISFHIFQDGSCPFHAPWGRSAFLLTREAVLHDLCSTRWVVMPSTLQGGYAPQDAPVSFMFCKVDPHVSHVPRTNPKRDSPLPSRSILSSRDNCLSGSLPLLSKCLVTVNLSS